MGLTAMTVGAQASRCPIHQEPWASGLRVASRTPLCRLSFRSVARTLAALLRRHRRPRRLL